MLPTRRPSFSARVLLVVVSLLACDALRAQDFFYDQTLAQHRARYDAMRASGHRLVSVDVAGSLSSQRWASTWELSRSRTQSTALFGVDFAQLFSWRAQRRAEGYREAWVTSAGAGSSTVYGLVMVRDGLGTHVYDNLDPAQLNTTVALAHGLGWVPLSASVHGSLQEPRYSIIFADNPGKLRWGYCLNETPSSFQQKFDAFTSTCYARPLLITASLWQRYLGIFRGDSIGEWQARHDLTPESFVIQTGLLLSSGYRVHQITCAGVGALTRYSAIYVRGSAPQKQLTVTGYRAGGFQAIDEMMLGDGSSPGFLREHNAREVGVAITKDGKLIFARAYTWGLPGDPVAQPTSGFRIASCTKPLTAIGVYRQAQRSRGTSVDSTLVSQVALGTPLDSRVNQITLRHLIDHRSGYERSWPTDVTDKLGHARQTIQNELLDAAPGAQRQYSNGGYQLLGLALGSRSG